MKILKQKTATRKDTPSPDPMTKLISVLVLTGLISAAFAMTAYATGIFDEAAGVQLFEELVQFIALWIQRIAMVVVFFGIIGIALSLKSQNPDARLDAMMLTGAGIITFAAAAAFRAFTVGGFIV